MISYFFRLFFLLLPVVAVSQVTDQVVAQPALNISWKTENRWSFNTTLAQRTQVANGVDGLHIQLAQFAQYEIGFYSSVGIGIMYRELFDEQSPEELRITEQFVHARSYNKLKIAHRLRWDQRLRDGRSITHRWRYRLSSSIPLSGNNVDVSEFYATGSVETLFIAESNRRPEYDQRVEIGLGRQLRPGYKLQLTTEYRWESFNLDPNRRLFFYLSLYAQL